MSRLEDQFREAIRTCGMSLTKLAAECVIHRVSLSRFVHGKAGMKSESLGRIADKLGLMLVTGGLPVAPPVPETKEPEITEPVVSVEPVPDRRRSPNWFQPGEPDETLNFNPPDEPGYDIDDDDDPLVFQRMEKEKARLEREKNSTNESHLDNWLEGLAKRGMDKYLKPEFLHAIRGPASPRKDASVAFFAPMSDHIRRRFAGKYHARQANTLMTTDVEFGKLDWITKYGPEKAYAIGRKLNATDHSEYPAIFADEETFDAWSKRECPG